MAFHFRFQSLLRYREHQRSAAQAELASAIRRHERAVQLLEAARHERRRHQELLEQRQQTGISAVDYVTMADYLLLVERQLLIMEKEVAQLAQDVLTAKELVMQRQTEVRRLECLETSDRAIYRSMENRKERAQLDENAIVRNAKTRRELRTQD